MRRAILLALVLAPVWGGAGIARERTGPCSPAADQGVARGWAAFRADSLEVARHHFAEAARLCPSGTDGRVGLGFARLRLGDAAGAESLFRTVTAVDPENADAWEGLALAARRRGDRPAAREAARRALALDGTRSDARALLAGAPPEPPLPRRRAPTLQLPARTRGERFEVATPRGWAPFQIRGVNLGAALPGRFPAEFPEDSARYAGWLAQIAGMNANAVRLYTVFPPVFYRALRDWNRAHPDSVLWLVHGVWTELPPRDDFEDPAWKEGFRAEMRRVADLLHGGIEIPPRPGHAAGRYDADVSAWTLAYILGREWEPFAVKAFAARHPGRAGYRGRFLETAAAPATDRWMAAQCDHLLAYEFDAWNALRPVAYVNWPTLDPLRHPTESSPAEEAEWRRRVGRPARARRLEYENDGPELDPGRVRATAANPAGWFASYHAYPYYPDFLIHDPGYAAARSSRGPSSYFGYLQDLRRHHAGIPVVIAEFGVPSSRGLAHLQPQGFHHGGLDEREMAAIDARLACEIEESGCAGGILFAWIDEWFKRNWAVIDLELPADRKPLWLNVQDAEEHYGVIALGAGAEGASPRLGGEAGRWLELPAVLSRPQAPRGAPRTVRAGHDEARVYLAVELAGVGGVAAPWDSLRLRLALDTCRPDRGQRGLPGLPSASPVGFEFLMEIDGPEAARLRVAPDYNPYAGPAGFVGGDDLGLFLRRSVSVRNRRDGRFDSLWVTTNRARFTRDGRFLPARGIDGGRLRHAREEETTRADWFYDAAHGLVELRLPWSLLNVADPSSRTVLHRSRGRGALGTTVTDGFRMVAYTLARGGGHPIGVLPEPGPDGVWDPGAFPTWSWPAWETPRWHERLKPVYEAMRRVWGEPAVLAEREAPHE